MTKRYAIGINGGQRVARSQFNCRLPVDVLELLKAKARSANCSQAAILVDCIKKHAGDTLAGFREDKQPSPACK